MLLLNNWRHYLVILIITVVLGYFLGITVSTVVDYRLKDAIINLPRPKNKIMVKLNDSLILETFESAKDKKSKDKAKTAKSKAKAKTNKSKKATSKSKKATSKSKKATSKSKKATSKAKAKAKSKSKDDFMIENFSSKINDSNLKNYNNKFMKSESKSEISLFKAANEEDDDQNYQKFV